MLETCLCICEKDEYHENHGHLICQEQKIYKKWSDAFDINNNFVFCVHKYFLSCVYRNYVCIASVMYYYFIYTTQHNAQLILSTQQIGLGSLMYSFVYL